MGKRLGSNFFATVGTGMSAFLVVSFFAGAALAADLYVSPNGNDSNSGSQSAPFRTIKKAAQVVKAGTVVHVAPGTYAGDIRTNVSGSSSAPIRFVSDVKWGAKINSGSGSMAWDNRGAYVSIENFEVDGSAAQSWRWGIYSAGSNSQIKGNKVHDIMTKQAATSSGGAGMGGDNYYGATNINVIGNVVYNVGPAGAKSSLVHGIYQTATGTVANNVVHNLAGVGIHMWHDAHDIKIVNNTVYGTRNAGIMTGAGDSGINGGGLSSAAGDFFTVANNIIVNCAIGLYEYGKTGVHNKYYNNLVYNNATNIRLQNGLSASATVSADPKFVNASAADFRLQSSSPAIDKGSSQAAPAVDFDSAARPSGGAIDIGAFESGGTRSPASTPTPTPAPTPVPPMEQPTGSVQIVITGDPATSAYSIEAKTTVQGALRVELYDNGTLRGAEKTAPYCFTPEVSGACSPSKLGSGTHNLVVKVFSATGTTVLAQASRTVTEGGVAANGIKSFAAKNSGKCMDVAGASLADATAIQQWSCLNADNQRFEMVPMGNGEYLLKAKHSGKCVDIAGASLLNDAKVIQYACHSGANQRFTVKNMADGYVSLVSVKSGKCLDVRGFSTADGGTLVQWTCAGTTNQLFKMQ